MDKPTELQVVFTIEPDLDSGALVAYWDDPSGGGITTQAASLSELTRAIKEAVVCHFSTGAAPRSASLHFADAELHLAGKSRAISPEIKLSAPCFDWIS